MAAYVKFVETGMGIPVPIDVRSSKEDLKKSLQKINGLLIPGGGTVLQNEDGSLSEFSEQVDFIYREIKTINDQGTYFPIWAVCMGFQQIHVLEAPKKGVLGHYDSVFMPSPIFWNTHALESKLFRGLPSDMVEIVQEHNVTIQNHSDGVDMSIYRKFPELSEAFQVLSFGYDRQGVEYVDMVEHKDYPIYGV